MVNISGLKPNPKIPSVPDPLSNLQSLTTVVKTLRQGVQSLAGARGDLLDRAVTFNDLIALGLVTSGASIATVAATASVSSASKLYRIGVFIPGAPTAGQVLLRFTASDAILFPASMAGSVGSSDGAALSTAVLSILVAQGPALPNYFTQVGTISFASSAFATYSLLAPLLMGVGDVMHIVCTIPDVFLNDVSLTLAASRL